MTNFEIFI